MASFICGTFFSLLFLSNVYANPKHGFTVDLIHRDSPKSPFYNPTETSSQRMRNTILRSTRRALQDSSPNSAQSIIMSNHGEYLMNISIGTPPFPILAIADTGSDMIWTQCNPCDNCYKQNDPLFDPKRSSTYRRVSCSSSNCRALEDTFCSTTEDTCSYSVSYGDQSYTKGDVSMDTVTIGSTNNRRHVSLKNIIIGCGHDNTGTFAPEGSGIIGLGMGSTSLVSQLGKSIDGKFSYCLVPLMSEDNGLTSRINFGQNGVVSGEGVVSTPLVKKDVAVSFYFLTLEAISVGRKKIKFPGFGTEKGNIVIDSGTTLTLLPTKFYSELESAVASTIKAERVEDPEGVLSLCYRDRSDFEVPDIIVHFRGGDVKLNRINTFLELSKDLYCFAFAANDHLTVFGNVAQMNFLVGYDTTSETVSFKQTNCAQM